MYRLPILLTSDEPSKPHSHPIPGPNAKSLVSFLEDFNVHVRADASVPEDEIHFRHDDGRVDVFRIDGGDWTKIEARLPSAAPSPGNGQGSHPPSRPGGGPTECEGKGSQ